MLLKWINSNRPELHFFIPLFALLLWSHSVFDPTAGQVADSLLAGPLGRFLVDKVSHYPRISAIIALGVVIFHGLLLVQLNAKYIFLKIRTQSSQLIFIIVVGAMGFMQYLSSALVAQFFIIAMIFRLFDAFKKDRFAFNFVDAGILMALAVLCYTPTIFLFPLLFVALAIFRNFIWEEWVYVIIGFLLPYFFWGSYLFLTDQHLQVIGEEFRVLYADHETGTSFSSMQLALIVYLVFMIILGSIHMIRTIGNRKIQSRILFVFFLWMFILSIVTSLVLSTRGFEVFCFGGIPVTFLLSNYFATCKVSRANKFLVFLLLIGLLTFVADSWIGFIPDAVF